MTKSKNTKRALLASVISLLLCLTMLVGSTFAWFTDSVEAIGSKIVSGSLKVDLQAKGSWGDVEGENGQRKFIYNSVNPYTSIVPLNHKMVDSVLFDADILWEPGQVYTRELQIVNKGNLAVYYNVFIPQTSVLYNEVLEPIDDEDNVTLPGVDPATGKRVAKNLMLTERNLTEAIKVAYFKGSMDELITKLEKAKKDREAPTDLEITKLENGKKTITREAVLWGLEIDIFESDDFLGGNNAIDGAAISNAYGIEPVDDRIPLYPNPNTDGKLKEDLTKEDLAKIEDPQVALLEAGAAQEFVLIAYWAPEEEIIEWGYADGDDSFNLKNGRKATKELLCWVGWELDDEEYSNKRNDFVATTWSADNKNISDTLSLQFDIGVIATQAPHENDSFGKKYDENAYDDDLDDIFDDHGNYISEPTGTGAGNP